MMDVLSFEKECASVTQLHELLEYEQSCLVNATIEKLPAIIEKKSGLIQTLSQLSKQRYDCLLKNGYTANELGMNDWIAKQAPEKIQSAWLSTQQTLLKSRELNRVNGLLIGKQNLKNQQRLSILQGEPEPHTQVYGPNGQPTSKLNLRAAKVIG